MAVEDAHVAVVDECPAVMISRTLHRLYDALNSFEYGISGKCSRPRNDDLTIYKYGIVIIDIDDRKIGILAAAQLIFQIGRI